MHNTSKSRIIEGYHSSDFILQVDTLITVIAQCAQIVFGDKHNSKGRTFYVPGAAGVLPTCICLRSKSF